jgi:hypothetical protein
MTELDEIIETFVTDQHTCEIGLLPCTYCDAKTALTQICYGCLKIRSNIMRPITKKKGLE